MIQFILMLFNLAFPSNNANIEKANYSEIINVQNSTSESSGLIDDTGGETGQTPPPKR